MKPISMQCDRMARVAAEFCGMIEGFDHRGADGTWLHDMGKLLPRLHMAVTALASPEEVRHEYCLPDDDQRCELYLRLHERLQTVPRLRAGQHQPICDRLADDFTDMYFDLSRGLELLQACPTQPEGAESNWLCSFYLHWGQHLLDAEYWLRAVECRKGFAERADRLAWSYEDQNHHRE